MKKYIAAIVICCSFFLVTCKKSEIVKDPIDEKEYRETKFLKGVTVNGATKVVFDETKSDIIIQLPETYKDSVVYLDLTSYNGANLQLNPWESYSSANKVGFQFRGVEPYQFTLLREDEAGSISKTYKIYVEHLGQLSAKLTSEILLPPQSEIPSATVGVAFLSGIGTIPETPEISKKLTGQIADLSTSTKSNGVFERSGSYIYFENVDPFILSKNLSLSLTYGDKTFTFPGNTKLTRSPLTAGIHTWTYLEKSKAIQVSGGYFLDDAKYSIKIESDFVTKPIWVNATKKSHVYLSFMIPPSVANGDYLISVYENEVKISGQNFVISNGSEPLRGIGKMWNEKLEYPSGVVLFKNSERVIARRGEWLYADPKPWIIGNYLAGFDANKKMPDLELKNGSEIITIPAITNGDLSYGDGAHILYYGSYKIPSDMAPGKYEARMIYSDGVKSAPWWSLVTIN